MVQDKKEEKTKKKLQIKAKTGAWWKSTSVEEVEATATAEKPKKAGSTATSRKRKPATAKKTPAPRKSRAKKSQETVASENEGEGLRGQETPLEDGASEKVVSAAKASAPASKAKQKARPARTTKRGSQAKKTTGKAKELEGQKDPAETPEVAAKKQQDLQPDAPAMASKPGQKARAAKTPKRGRQKKKEPAVNEAADAGLKEESVGTKEEERKQPSTKEQEQAAAPDKETAIPDKEIISKLLINAEEPEECRVALLENGRLESIQVQTASKQQRKNNIYKARIVAIEPSLQAAFVDYGTEKNGFLPFNEIHPEYYRQDLRDDVRQLVETHQWKKLSITDVLTKGQELLAQVVKEEIGKKGANMTTYLSIPGRCVVLMPGSDSAGISRKISGEERRSKLRDIMKSFAIPEGIGWIVRTASIDITEAALSRDVDYLLKLWEDIKAKGQSLDGVGMVYEDQHSVLRFLRENFDPSLSEILVDDKAALADVKAFVGLLPDAQRGVKVRLHQGARPIFNQYSIEDQIESIYQPQVNLPSGGSIVINPTEALVAIDVNSGSTSKGKNFEASIFQANLEAATELARQLRLRDLGGLIVVDFIDMRSRKNILAVEKQVKAAMKRDKAKTDFSRISKFGLMQISRQKLGAPIESGNYRRCEHCKGRGTVRSVETLSLFYLRRIQTGASRKPVEKIDCHLPMEVASYLLNKKRIELGEMEKRYQVEIMINARTDMNPADNEIIFHKAEKEAKPQKQA